MVGMDAKDCFVGDEAQAKRGILKLKRPMKGGTIVNLNDMEKVWHHSPYNELCITPEEHPLLMSYNISPNSTRVETTKIQFETFNVPALAFALCGVLSLYASGRTTGISLDVGGGQTTAIPIYSGYAIHHAVKKIPIGGQHVTDRLMKMFSDEEKKYGSKFVPETSAEFEIVRDVKEKLGYISQDYQYEVAESYFRDRVESNISKFSYRQYLTNLNKIPHYQPLFDVLCADCVSVIHSYRHNPRPRIHYELPDGSKVSIGSERFRAPEVLFSPSLIGSEHVGISQLVAGSIEKCDIDVRKDLYQNVVLSGGSSMFEGIEKRLRTEMKKIIPKGANVKINAPAERKFSTWIGGSILSSLATFQHLWITKEEYDDHGPNITLRRFF